MAWADALQDASLGGVALQVASSDDAFSWAVVSHSYPYRDGVELEHLGREERRISLRVVLYGDNYEGELAALLDVCNQRTPQELVHPVYGTLQVMTKSVGTPFAAEDPDYSLVPLELIEHGLERALFTQQGPTALCDAALSAQLLAGDSTLSAFSSAVGTVTGGLRAMQDTWANMRLQVQSVAGPALSVFDALLSGVDLLGEPARFVRALAQGFTLRIDGLLNRTQRLPHIALPEWQAAQRAGTALSLSKPSPAQWPELHTHLSTPLLPTQYRDAQNVTRSTSPVMLAQVQYGQALAIAQAATRLLQAQMTETVEGDDTPEMTPQDIDKMVADVRTALDDAMTQWRAAHPGIEQHRPATEADKRVAVQVQTLADTVVNLRPPLIHRYVAKGANLRLLAHWWYGEAERAYELLRLNPQLREPNFVRQAQVLRCYAQ